MAELVVATAPLGLHWPTIDPFLFCAHHDDAYPPGNEHLGPAASLSGRRLGMDFEPKDGWRMYHGDTVPGFPRHPHRGFETVTLARRGYIDHSDSLGATARFGRGDVQWMTAGRGIVHSEMFPLIQDDAPNSTELFQVWLNLPAKSKMVEPHFKMLWGDTIPRHTISDERGGTTHLTIVAGAIADVTPPAPPPHSWAARAEGDVAIWHITMTPGARCTLPAAAPGSLRTLYFYQGSSLRLGTKSVTEPRALQVQGERELPLENGSSPAELLLLQGKPIAEPVAHQGPFVMNTRAELARAFDDYRRTGFGGWPWSTDDPVHPRARGRFAQHADGTLEER